MFITDQNEFGFVLFCLNSLLVENNLNEHGDLFR